MRKNDDNQFFQFNRILVLKDSSSGKDYKFKCKLFYCSQEASIDLYPTLQLLEHRHPKIKSLLRHSQLFYFNKKAQTNLFVGNYPLEQPALTSYNEWVELTVTLNYRKKELDQQMNPPKTEDKSSKRAGEKTIQEAMDCIERWSRAMEQNQGIGRQHSMVAAAKNIGISKKTLDDYSRCLRLGQQFGFNLQERSSQKISVLRNYVKQQRSSDEGEEKKFEDPDIFWENSFFKNYD